MPRIHPSAPRSRRSAPGQPLPPAAAPALPDPPPDRRLGDPAPASRSAAASPARSCRGCPRRCVPVTAGPARARSCTPARRARLPPACSPPGTSAPPARSGRRGCSPGPPPDPGMKRAMGSLDPEEVKRAGNEMYRRGLFAEALRLYDRAIVLSPENAAFRSNRAAALTGLRRLGEAVKECEEAVRLDPAYSRAHQRLTFLHIRLGNVEKARKHLNMAGQQQDAADLQKLNALEVHLARCADARRIGDWKSALRESDAAIVAGADSSPLIAASRAEALLRLHKLDEADGAISGAFRLETLCPSCSQTKFFGMLANSYMYMVRAKVEMAFGRFDNAVAAAEKARQIDPGSAEVTAALRNVRSVANARAEGNRLFNSGKFVEACLAYGEGLKLDPSNPVLYCNRAACRSKLGQWERSVDDCNEALKIQPNYTKALLRRASSSGKLERWAESVQDYEILRKELPGDADVAEALLHAQLALKTSRGEVSTLRLGGEVEEVTAPGQFQAAISTPGVHVAFFSEPSNQDCIQMSQFVDTLCNKYPSVNFLKIDIKKRLVPEAERVKTVPTFSIYKSGARVKELIRPNPQTLEYAVRCIGL